MKRRNLFLLAAFMLSIFSSNAQNTEKGDMILNLGLGIGNNYTLGGDGFSITIPPISASFEYIVKDDLFGDGKGALGVGAYAQYMNYDYEITSNPGVDVVGGTVSASVLKSATASPSVNDWKYTKFIFGPRGYFHYNLLDILDTYTGLMLGLDHVSWGSGNSDYTHNDFIWSWFVGGRYYFNDNLAGMLELGYGATYVNIGIAYKFGK